MVNDADIPNDDSGGSSQEGSGIPISDEPIGQANVVQGAVPMDGDDDNTAAWDTSEDNGIRSWIDYEVNSRYEKDGHVYMMGITSPGGFSGNSVAFAQIASPTLLMICDWTAASWSEQPLSPDPTPVSDDWIILDEHYDTMQVTYGADGNSCFYRLSGTFTYGHTNPADVTVNNIGFALPPFAVAPQTGVDFAETYLDNTILPYQQ